MGDIGHDGKGIYAAEPTIAVIRGTGGLFRSLPRLKVGEPAPMRATNATLSSEVRFRRSVSWR